MKPMEEYSWVRGFCYGYGHGKTVETRIENWAMPRD